MATLHKSIVLPASVDTVWAAVRDIGALETRLVPGFVTKTVMESPDVRLVTFANGMTAREPIISLDDERRRIAWCTTGGVATHYNTVVEVTAEGDRARLTWTTDVLPCELESAIGAMQDHALAAMQRRFS